MFNMGSVVSLGWWFGSFLQPYMNTQPTQNQQLSETWYVDQKKEKNKSCLVSKKSPTGPKERTPKPEYLIALASYLGVRW